MEPEYDFCYTKDKPETLVMLRNVKSVSKLLFADPQLNTFVWIGDRDDQQMMNAKQRIQLQLGEFFYFYSSVQSAKKQLLQDRPQYTVLVINIQMFKEGKQLNSIHKVKSTFFYSKTNDFYYKYMRPYAHSHQNQQIDSEDEEYQQQQNEANQWLQNVYTDQKQLTEKLKEYKGTTTGQKVLPNFVFMAHQIRTSHTLVRTMHSMLNQRIDEETASQINGKFKTLIGYLQQFDKNLQGKQIQMDKECFCKALQNGLKTDKQIVSWYTDETFVYKLTNNLLRAHRHPAEVFYIQPYVKLLFNTIHKFYIEESKEIKETTKIWEFKVYRGGKMNKEQFEMFKNNKGQTIQNLGFFSTTLNIKIANKFQKKGNTLFQVNVVQNQIGASQFGFVNIEKWGLGRFGQQQILFNPLNTFQILDVQQPIQSEYSIKLRYRLFDDEQKEKQKQGLEQSWRKIAQLQKQEKYQNECQGNALTNQYYHFKEGDKCWNKYLQLVSKIDKKYRNQLDKIKKKSQDEELKISKSQLKFGNSQINVSFQENIKQSISQTSIQKNIEAQITFNKLKQVYGQWNSIFNQVINQKGKLFSYKIKDFKFELTNLFGNEHPISLKFLDSLKDSLSYQPSKKQQGNLCKKISEKELFEKQPQFMYLKSVTANRFQHHQKQKQRIIKKLNLSNSQLNDKTINEIREIFTEQIEQLNLDQNKLTQIPYFIYEIKNLRKISINNNELRQFKEELQEQQSVKMQQKNSQQNTINENQLSENQRKKIQIKKKLKQNKIQEDKKNCFKQQKQEKGKKIGQIKTKKNKQKRQQQKWIFNKLSSFPKSIGNLTSLRSLSLQDNKLSSLPESIGNLTSIKSLYLQNNQLSSLPQSIGNLTSLQQLYLSTNKLIIIPKFFRNLIKLSKLDLSSNKLLILPDSFQRHISLRILCINNNSLHHLSKSVSQLTLLQQLNVSNNFLEQLPSILKLVNLRVLNVSFNPISSSALVLISQNQIKVLVDQKQMSVIKSQKCSTKSVLFVVDGQAAKTNIVKPKVD